MSGCNFKVGDVVYMHLWAIQDLQSAVNEGDEGLPMRIVSVENSVGADKLHIYLDKCACYVLESEICLAKGQMPLPLKFKGGI